MGNSSSTLFLPSPRTTFNKLLFWFSKQFGWSNFEISDFNRTVVKTTITVDRENAPAAALRRRLRSKMNCEPNTVGFMWTKSHNITTVVTEHI